MPNEAAGEGSISPETQALKAEFMGFIGDSVKTEAKLIIQPIEGNNSAYLLVSTKPNQENQTLVVNHATAAAVFDAQDLEDLDADESLSSEAIDTKRIAAVMAGRIMQKTAPK